MKWLLALILVVGVLGVGSDGRWDVECSDLRLSTHDSARLLVVQEKGALNGTPDSILRGNRGPDIRVAGERVAVEQVAEGVTSASGFSGYIAYEQSETLFGAPSEGEVDGLWRITIYCCRNDPGGAYCGVTASGVRVAPGMAACSEAWEFGTTFLVYGDTVHPEGVVCTDRGSAVVERNHLDIHFEDCGIQEDPAEGTGWAWLSVVGDRAIVEVLQ